MTAPVNFTPTHQAVWTQNNSHLKPRELTSLIQRVVKFVKDIFLFIPRHFATKYATSRIYPAASPVINNQARHEETERNFNLFWNSNEWTSFTNEDQFDVFLSQDNRRYNLWLMRPLEEAKKIRENYEPKAIELKTPDNETLHGHFIQNRHDPNCEGKVVLVFGGNVDLYRDGATVYPMLGTLCENETPVSYLMVDPRSVYKSTGTATRDGLLIDADTLYQYAENALGFDKDNIVIYGQSFGGAMASHLKGMHEESNAPVIVSRSFSSLNDMAKTIGSQMPLKPVGLLQWTLKQTGWVLDSAKTLAKLRSDVVVLNHPNDEIIPEESSVPEGLRREFGNLPENFDVKTLKFARDHHDTPHAENLRHMLVTVTNSYGEQRDMGAVEYLREKVFTVETPPAAVA